MVLLVAATSAMAADMIRATVRNVTTSKPSAGDEVLLLLANGMQEESRVRTDDRGSFTLPVNLPGQPHVIRVVHDGVNYDYPWTKGLVPELKVFNAAAKVVGLKGYATIVKLESDGEISKITELYAITNESNPPRTQTAPHNLEIYPPQAAEMDSAIVAGPEGLPVKVIPTLVGGG